MRPLSEVSDYCVELGPDGGAFRVPFEGRSLLVIVSFGIGWDHVSVSLGNRTPNWREMEYVKRLFFKDDEWAMQLHAPPSKHISIHPHCLHLWRPQGAAIPVPPEMMV
jgi:hypothetical protein